MYVYIVEHGCYSSRGIVGVYATPEAAMKDHPTPTNTYNCIRHGGWKPSSYCEDGQGWDNGFDWDDHKEITRFEVGE